MSSMVAAGMILSILPTAERRYGLDPAALLATTGLHPDEVKDPSTQVPVQAVEHLMRAVLERTGDRALGLRIAEDYDLRTQGFWGYALLSSTTLRERLLRNIRYAPLRSPTAFRMHVDGCTGHTELVVGGYAPELVPIIVDMTYAALFYKVLSNTGYRLRRPATIRLRQRELPHHRELRAVLPAQFEFDAAGDGMSFHLEELDVELVGGDPHLGQLVTAQLDAQLSALTATDPRPLLERVRRRIAARLHDDASIERVAHDLQVSVRTLQRKLEEHGTSFSALTARVRHGRAAEYLTQTDDSIERIAEHLGYGDASTFRRAFRRWAGCAPAAYRAARKCAAE